MAQRERPRFLRFDHASGIYYGRHSRGTCRTDVPGRSWGWGGTRNGIWAFVEMVIIFCTTPLTSWEFWPNHYIITPSLALRKRSEVHHRQLQMRQTPSVPEFEKVHRHDSTCCTKVVPTIVLDFQEVRRQKCKFRVVSGNGGFCNNDCRNVKR